jgi:hypothetical protein
MLWGGGEDSASIDADLKPMERLMQKLNDLSRSLTPLDPDSTLIAVIEMSLSSWLVAGIVPGVERQPLKKLAVDESVLLKLLHRWRGEAEKAGYMIKRIAVAFARVDCRQRSESVAQFESHEHRLNRVFWEPLEGNAWCVTLPRLFQQAEVFLNSPLPRWRVLGQVRLRRHWDRV